MSTSAGRRYIGNRHDRRRARRSFPACAALENFVYADGRSLSPCRASAPELFRMRDIARAAADETASLGRMPHGLLDESELLSEIDREMASRGFTRSHILSVSLLCGGLHGSPLDARLRLLLAAHLTDPDALPVLLDHAETLGLDVVPIVHEDGTISGPWERVDVEWPEMDEHEHVWLPETTLVPGHGRVRTTSLRCTCGEYLHGQDAEYKLTAGAHLIAERAQRGDCTDPNCELPSGHSGAHWRRYDAGHGNVVEGEWISEEPQ